MPDISIITCTFNSEKWLEKNIDSISRQNFKNFEHIFIDGYSNDNTLNIIKKYQSQFPKQVRYFQSPPQGISNAMNLGIKKATGTYLIHLHSDDYLDGPETLNKVWNFIKKNNFPDWIYGQAVFINEANNQSRIIPHRQIYTQINKNLLLLTNYVPHQSVLIKKNVFENYDYFREDLKNSMDYEFWVRISDKTKSRFFPQVVSHFSIRPESQSEKFKETCISENKQVRDIYVKNPLLKHLLNIISSLNSKRKLV